MFCVSESPRLKIYIRSESHEHYPNGTISKVIPRIWVEFLTGGGLPDYAQKKALDTFRFAALPIGADPLERVGWFDTEMYAADHGLSDEDKKVLEDYMRAHDGGDFIIVEKPKVEPPWASYEQKRTPQGRRTLDFIIDEISSTLEATGESPAAVVEWEEQEQRPGWEEVVARMRKLQDALPEVEPDPLVAA